MNVNTLNVIKRRICYMCFSLVSLANVAGKLPVK